MKLTTALITAVATALVVVPSAMAHVTINPDKAPADSFSRFALRVPTEEPVPRSSSASSSPRSSRRWASSRSRVGRELSRGGS